MSGVIEPPQGTGSTGGSTSGNIVPSADTTYTVGTATLRYKNVNVSKDFSVWLSSADTQPQIQLDSASVALLIGAGGSTAPDIAYARNGANQASIYTNNSTGSLIERFRVMGNAAQGSAAITSFEPLQFANVAMSITANPAIYSDSSGDILFNTVGSYLFGNSGTNNVEINSSGQMVFAKTFYSYNGITLVSQGLPLVVATASQANNTGAVSNAIDYAPPSTSSQLYRLTCSIDVGTSTTHSFSVIVTYTDRYGNPLSTTLGGFSKSGAVLTTGLITNTTGAGIYALTPLMIAPDNSGTAITLSTASGGTYTSVAYSIEALLERIT